MTLKPVLTYSFANYEMHIFKERPHLDMVTVKQTHSDILLHGNNIKDLPQEQEGDGIVLGDTPMIAAVKTADCIPIAVIGAKGACLIHAGWRGVAKEIHLHREVHKIQPHFFFLGPSIQKKSFNVTAEFPEHFPKGLDFYDGKTFDLQSYVCQQILHTFPQAKIENCKVDTFTHDSLHSYRKNKTTNRNWNVLIPKKFL